MSAKPTTCVIGAGISGLTAGKALSDWGIPYTCFEASDDIGGQLVLPQPQRPLLGLPVAAHRHLARRRLLPRHADGPGRVPGLPAPHPDPAASCTATPTRSRCATGSASRPRSSTPSARTAAAGGSRSATARPRSSTSCSSATATTGTRASRTSPAASTGETIHSHHYIDPTDPLDLYGKRVLVVGIGNSARRHRLRALAQGRRREGLHLDPQRRLGDAEVLLRQARSTPLVKINPRLPLKLQRRLARPLPRLASGRMEDFGLPHPNHKFLEAHPTVSSELLLRLGSGDAVAKPNVERARGRPRPLRGRQRRAGRRDHLRDRLQDHLPVLRPRASSRRPTTGCRSTSGCSSRASTTSPSSASPRRSRRSSRSSSCSRKLVARYVGGDYALPSIAEMEETIRRDEAIHTGDFSDRPRHTMQIEWYTYEHDIWNREIPAGRERAASGYGAEARRPGADRGGRSCLERASREASPSRATGRPAPPGI